MSKNIGKKKLKQPKTSWSCWAISTWQSATDTLKTVSKRAIQKTADLTSDLIGNKIPNKITKTSRISQQNNSEAVTKEHDKEIPKERYVSPEERQKIIDDLRLI